MAATPRNSRRGWKISGRARIRSLDRSTRATFQLLFVSGIGERIMHRPRYLNSNNTDFGGRKWVCKRTDFDKNIGEQEKRVVNKISEMPCARNSARKRAHRYAWRWSEGSDIAMLLPLLRSSAAYSREKCSIPGKTIPRPWYGMDGKVEMHVVARVTTRKSPPSSRRI